jgi:hypothetical protein
MRPGARSPESGSPGHGRQGAALPGRSPPWHARGSPDSRGQVAAVGAMASGVRLADAELGSHRAEVAREPGSHRRGSQGAEAGNSAESRAGDAGLGVAADAG